jgi:hypothetical protein
MTAKDRLKFLISQKTPERGRFTMLAELGGAPMESWKAFWHGRQRPTTDMLQAVARNWPEYAYWLATGGTDQQYGHRAPVGFDTYPEPDMRPRERAADYLRLAVSMRAKEELGLEQSATDVVELKRLNSLRKAESAAFEQSEVVQPEEEVAIQEKIDELSDGKDEETRSRLSRILDDLQRRKALSDEQFANMLGLSVEEMGEIRAGKKALPIKARYIMVDKWGYTLLRDLFLAPLPSSWSDRLRNLDIVHGQNMHGKR